MIDVTAYISPKSDVRTANALLKRTQKDKVGLNKAVHPFVWHTPEGCTVFGNEWRVYRVPFIIGEESNTDIAQLINRTIVEKAANEKLPSALVVPPLKYVKDRITDDATPYIEMNKQEGMYSLFINAKFLKDTLQLLGDDCHAQMTQPLQPVYFWTEHNGFPVMDAIVMPWRR